MHPGPHYYVIRLGKETHTLHEAFRDTLIDVQNGGFPVHTRMEDPADPDSKLRRQRFLELVDARFDRYYTEEPLMLVVVGDRETQAAFASVTDHKTAIVGRVEGDHVATSLSDLGKIVWPVVKEAMSGVRDRALHELDVASQYESIAIGLLQVGRRATSGEGNTLLVEEDYHVTGTVTREGARFEFSPSVDIRQDLDDVVDVIIDRVLSRGGNVIFMPSGVLQKVERIALLLKGQEE